MQKSTSQLAWFLLAWFAPVLPAQTWQFQSMAGLKPVQVKAELAKWHGRSALRLLDEPGMARGDGAGGSPMTILAGSDFEDGTIEADFAAAPRAGAMEAARGFAGIAFRMQPDNLHYECIYLRPTNGRADDQLRRNHSTQYIASPDFPWERLRRDNPGVYESYTDLEPGAWTSMKIVVSGDHARLYVNGAAQPCLIVNDLKLGKTHGKIALWIGPDTDAHFSRVVLRKEVHAAAHDPVK